MKDEVGKTMLQLVGQNHATLVKTLSAVNDKTITLLDTHFFSDAAQFRFWTGIETLSQITAADNILERWSSDGTAYTLYMQNRESRSTPFDLSSKPRGFKYYGADAPLPEWAARTLEQGGGASVRLIDAGGAPTVSFMRSILNPKAYDETIGLLVVSRLEVLLTRDLVGVQLPAGTGVFLVNGDDEVLMQLGSAELSWAGLPEQAARQVSGYAFTGGEDGRWLYAYSGVSAFGTRLIYRIPEASITGNLAALQVTLLVASAIYLALVLIFALYLVRIIVKPLLHLVAITKIYAPGKRLDIEQRHLRPDEFGLLYGAFLKMTNRLDHTIEENYGMQIKQKEYELAMLHSQITPHLLYNTLDSIYWYALDSGNTDVGDMVKDLSRLLRIGLSKGKAVITVGEELEHAQAYTRLQMKRYPDAFEARWTIDERVLDQLTPKVILQPLVENAIFHAVSGMDGEGLIEVRAHEQDGELRLIVEDNGFLPVDLERLARIVSGEEEGRGYGIRNVHQRVQLHFGDGYGLHYEPREGGGLRAVLRLPLRRES
ncbi:sensor histidine kinase [Paenibacillus sp. IB182496]|uniref:histidine kinase n=1 Tax=Paenibacillus sabuli TaxID=2772509 RepID=A0A927BNR6_9BACL|nr:sensor histidine kinase [Paenibacillus sabuli]MBD2843926.1 sensor histidine kinase [Paenibacillus sabuli]